MAVDFVTCAEVASLQLRQAFRAGRVMPIAQIRSWLQSQPPELEPDRPDMLVNLVATHIEECWERGSAFKVEAYAAEFGSEFPRFASPATMPAELIECEFVTRHRPHPWCDHPPLAEYFERFPYRPDVRSLLESRCLDDERYIKVRRIGQGALGRVWEAYDRNLGRDVAIKEPHPPVDNEDAIRNRLAVEARVTAKLDHPAIVTVHELQDQGETFYVMRLVRGQRLTEVIHEHHYRTLRGSGQRLALGHLLNAFSTVCNAMAHAHTRGVLHRDLKPHNIVVGEFGETVVLDWGLAHELVTTPSCVAPGPHVKCKGNEQATANTSVVVHGEDSLCPGIATEIAASAGAGTLQYMSPEQTNGLPLDARSDIFGLGAILYHLLTGRPPYEDKVGETTTELWARVRQASYAPPRTLEPRAPKALEAVCLRAMARDRDRRYATADELAQEVDRFMADERPEVYAEPWYEATARWMRRHKPIVTGLASASAMLLLMITGAALIFGARAHEQAKQQMRTNEAISDALSDALRLEAHAQAARSGESMLWTEAREMARRAETLAETSLTDPALLARVRELRTRLDDELRDRRMVARVQEARILGTQVNVGENRFSRELAIPEYEAAFREYGIDHRSMTAEQAAERSRSRPLAIQLALIGALDDWIDLELRFGNKSSDDQQKQVWLKAVVQGVDTDSWRGRMREAIEREDNELLAKLADAPEMSVQAAYSLERLGKVLCERAGRRDLGIAVLRRVQQMYPSDFWINSALGLALREATPQQRDDAIRFCSIAVALAPDSAGAHGNLGCAFHDQGKLKEAIAEFRKAIELKVDDAVAHNNLGVALGDQGKLEEAVAEYRTAIELKPDFAMAHKNLGADLLRQGNFDEAIAACRTAIKLKSDYAEAHSDLGSALREQGKLKDAITECRRSIELKPNYPEAHNNLGNALCDEGDLEEAIAEYRRAVELKPDYALSHSNLANALRRQGNLEEAIAECRRAIELKPDYAEAHGNLGDALRDQGKMEQAEAEYRTATELKPDFVEAHNNLGAALVYQRKLVEAIGVLRRTIELNPGHASAYQNLGAALAYQGKLDEAISELRKAIELKPDNAEAHNNLGNALHRQGKVEEAITECRKAIELKPDYPEAHSNLGVALHSQGNLEEAIAEHRKAIELKPDYATAHCNLGTVLRVQDKLEEAIAEFRRAIELKPDYADAYNNLGTTLHAQGKLTEAIAAYRRAIELKPDYHEAHNNLGAGLYAQGSHDEAIANYRKAIELKPDYPDARNNLFNTLHDQGKLEDAITECRKAIELKPDDAVAHNNLGIALRDQGKQEEAIAELRRAIELRPDFVEAHCNLGHALRHKGLFAEALIHLKRGHELGSRNPRWRNPSAQWVRDCERLVELDASLPRVLVGDQPIADARERVSYADLCYRKRQFELATRFYEEALAQEPALAGDLTGGHRYNAACTAALAGRGEGEDAAALGEHERARRRGQALDWLRADLQQHGRELEKARPDARAATVRTLQHWLSDPDLKALRDDDSVDTLPPDEREACTKLWSNVRELVGHAQSGQ